MKTLLSVLIGAVILAITGPETVAQIHQRAEFEKPGRIVTLSPHLAELVFAAGAGDLFQNIFVKRRRNFALRQRGAACHQLEYLNQHFRGIRQKFRRVVEQV